MAGRRSELALTSRLDDEEPLRSSTEMANTKIEMKAFGVIQIRYPNDSHISD